MQGSKALSPSSTTVYTALYDVDEQRVATTSVTVTVLGQDEVTEIIAFGTLFCRNAAETLRLTLGSSTTGFDPSPTVSLTGVTNTSAARVVVASSSPSHEPVPLIPGELTTEFNGRVPREWSVRLDSTAVPPPTSCTVDTGGFEPIELTLALPVSCGQWGATHSTMRMRCVGAVVSCVSSMAFREARTSPSRASCVRMAIVAKPSSPASLTVNRRS